MQDLFSKKYFQIICQFQTQTDHFLQKLILKHNTPNHSFYLAYITSLFNICISIVHCQKGCIELLVGVRQKKHN